MKLMVQNQELKTESLKVECLFTKQEAEKLVRQLKKLLDDFPESPVYRIAVE